MPQTETLATPRTPSSFGVIVQRARTEAFSDTSFGETPTIIARLVVERGCSMTGGFETLGSACAKLRRSCTNWRARMRSVPVSKTRMIDESPVIDFDRMVLSQETLASI